jgi:hypothetical protein
VLGVDTKGVVITFHHPCDRRGVGTRDVSMVMGASTTLSRSGVSSSSKTVPDDMIRWLRFTSSSSSKAVPAESRVSFLLWPETTVASL